MQDLRPRDASIQDVFPFTDAKNLAEEAVTSVEKRRCIFALDVCARSCYRRATGSGKYINICAIQNIHSFSNVFIQRSVRC